MRALRSARFIAVLACVPFLLSGTCYYSSHNLCGGWHTHGAYEHCHVHVYYDGHSGTYPADHDHSYAASSHQHPWVLREYTSEVAGSFGGVELVRITPISRIDLGLAVLGASSESDALRDATAELREVNDELLGATVGRFVFSGAEHVGDTVRVVWRQVPDGLQGERSDGMQVFVLDDRAVLREVHNRLWR